MGHLGNGMIGAKRVRYSYILTMANLLNVSIAEMNRIFGKGKCYFYETAHANRKCFISKSAVRFLDAIQNDEELPPPSTKVDYATLRNLVKKEGKEIQDFAQHLGYSCGQSIKRHSTFNCGEVLLAMDFLGCTYEQLAEKSSHNSEPEEKEQVKIEPVQHLKDFDGVEKRLYIISQCLERINVSLGNLTFAINKLSGKE